MNCAGQRASQSYVFYDLRAFVLDSVSRVVLAKWRVTRGPSFWLRASEWVDLNVEPRTLARHVLIGGLAPKGERTFVAHRHNDG